MIVPFVLLGLSVYGVFRLVKHSGGARTPTYTFAKGDQPEAVARRFSTTVATIQGANGNVVLRMIAPDGSMTSIYLPPGAKDQGAQAGAQGKAVL